MSGIIYRPGGPVSLVGRSGEPAIGRTDSSGRCRWCGRSTGNTRGVIEHIDRTPGGTDWAEHIACRPLPDPDPRLADWRI